MDSFGDMIADFVSVAFFLMLCLFAIFVAAIVLIVRWFKINPRGQTFTPRSQSSDHLMNTMHSHTISVNTEPLLRHFETNSDSPHPDFHSPYNSPHSHHHHAVHDAGTVVSQDTQNFDAIPTPTSIDLGVFTDNSNFSNNTDFGSDSFSDTSFSASIDTSSSSPSIDPSSSSSF